MLKKRRQIVVAMLHMAMIIGLPSKARTAVMNPPEWVGIYDVGGAKAGLLWIKSLEANKYKIYRRREDEDSFTLIGETSNNRFTDDTLQPRITYYYRLVGILAQGDESPPSEEFAFTLQPRTKEALTTPQWEGYIVLEKGIGLKWEHSNPELVIAYNLYRTGVPDGREELLASTRERSFNDTKVESGKEYKYFVTALGSNLIETERSAELTVRYEKKVQPGIEKAPAYTWTPLKTFLIKTFRGGVKSTPLLSPTDIVLLPQNRLAVSDSGNGLIQIFSRSGDFIAEFPVPPAPGHKRAVPLGLTVDKEGRIICTDAYSGRVIIFNARGNIFRTLDVPLPDDPKEKEKEKEKDDKEKKAFRRWHGLLDVCQIEKGDIYVVDNAHQRVAVFDSSLKLDRFFGKAGQNPGDFYFPGFCDIDAEGNIVVTDALASRVQFFSAEGQFVKAFGRYSKNVGRFARPKGIAIDGKGRIFVADSWLCQIQVFDSEGAFLYNLADEKGESLDLGAPNGIAVDDEGAIYIVEKLAHRIQVRYVQTD